MATTPIRLDVAGVVCLIWLILGSIYVRHVPPAFYDHDYDGHVRYTEILAHEHRFPTPHEGWETYHPPLYYLVNASLPGGDRHVHYVRCLGWLYGFFFILLALYYLSAAGLRPLSQVVSMLLVITSPTYFFVFITYNNDPLAMLLAAQTLLLGLSLLNRFGRVEAGLFIGVATLGLYTKYNVILLLLAFVIMAGVLWARNALTFRELMRRLGLACCPLLLLTPWLLFHNYPVTHKLFPSNFENGINKELRLTNGAWTTVLTPPGFANGEWYDPFLHGTEPERTKKNCFLAALLTTSLFGEYTLTSSPAWMMWAILYLHLLFYFWAARQWIRAPRRFDGLLVMIGVFGLAFFTLRSPTCPSMDFRYIAWIWIPLAALYGGALENDDRSLNPCRITVFTATIVAQIVVVCQLKP